MITGIKHIAFAVKDAQAALGRYQQVLGLGEGAQVRELAKARSREAHFKVGDTEYQLCQSIDADGRFTQHIARYGESVHHICYTVDDIEATLAAAQRAGARLKECKSCQVTGIHPHPEGFIAFLEDGTVPGADVELMQVYRDEAEVPEQFKDRFRARTI